MSARGRCRLGHVWVGPAQVPLKWECVFVFMGARSSLRSFLSVSRVLLSLAAPQLFPVLWTLILGYPLPFVSF